MRMPDEIRMKVLFNGVGNDLGEWNWRASHSPLAPGMPFLGSVDIVL